MDLIEVEDRNGHRVTITQGHWDRWPSVRENFRPVAESKETTLVVVDEPPTGDNETEN